MAHHHLRGLAAALCLALTGTHALAANENIYGAWDPAVYDWPLIPVHAVLMPDGRILSYGTDNTGKQTGYFIYDVWDISAGPNGGHLTLPNVTNTDIFCGSQVVLPQGDKVYLAGGDNWTGTGTTNTGNNNSNVFSLGDNTLTRGNNMNRARWYSSTTVLLNGEVMTQGGSGGTDRPEIRGTDGVFRVLTGADTSTLDFMYPRNYIAPDGRVFGFDSNGRMYYLNPTGTGSITLGAQLPAGNRGSDASTAMFRPGKILQFGGSSSGAVVIDITSGTPVVTATQTMSSQRRLVNAAILPDGRVLATGGSAVWNELTNVNNSAEVWNPTTGTWTKGPDGQKARMYHSISMLLPDARVLVGGGGAPGPLNNLNMEIYNPSYLYDASGNRAVQPELTSAPAEVNIGQTFDVEFTNAADISRVTMVKAASVTHSWNMEQRFVELTFVRNGSRLRIQAPARAADAPPGFWMIFALNESGVPSVARIVKVNVAPNWNPAIAPTLVNPGNRTNAINVPVSLQLSATDPNGDTLTYAASDLPTGLTLNTATGAIGGTPVASGSFNVVVSASDGINTAVQSFTWTIQAAASLVLNPPAPPAPVLAGAQTSYSTTSSNGVNVRYSWQFDDGTPDSPWSSSSTVTHTFTAPGVHYVTVWATDDTGITRAETVVQAVYLPATANKPTASANVTLEPRGTGNARLWVVNQDNDSVSVFDSVTRAKVKEITVGTAPRSIAAAPSGRLWVTNKQSNTISLIDPTSLAVAQTVTLPRASQPFGIAFSPTGNYAYVVLEGTGQLLRLDPTTGATVSTLAVGPNPRHVSVTWDGSSVLVSRFITPPLPGENTALVQTNSVGGEVVAVNAGTMTIAGTITLAHSDAPDFENQGRGVPNYLGAAAISPDGTQAWVPSKQDNILRGTGRDGQNLNFQNTVRAISSRIVMSTGTEDLGARIDHDNSSVASAVAYDQRGVYMFVALETSREVAVIDAHNHWEIFRIDVGRAPQGLTLSADGNTLYVNNFMDRTVSAFDLTKLMAKGATDVALLGTMSAVATEKLTATVLKGKQFFYDARDTRLARDRYMSCASCHNDGGQDGRVWDLTGMGEGLRNTISLRGRANAQGYLHWSANFDEVQDFEGQIRTLAGGTGLMSDANFNSGTRNQPLGQAKAGLSADLDALAAYVGSLNTFANSPYRNSDGTLTAAAVAGRAVFESNNCASCHGGTKFTVSGSPTLFNIGTIKPTSGQRLGGVLSGIDPPTLRDVWATAPYLHDGSASTLAAAVTAHQGVSITGTNLTNLVAFLQQIGGEEIAGCPCTLWKPTDVPASSSYDTTIRGGIELGTRFRASTTGYIKAIRFYKHTGNTGTHVGSLWSNSGSLLGRATFSNETATGWQEVNLATPIKVTAGTWYMVSYLTKSGKFIGQNNLFSSSGMTNGPLYAPRDGEAGDNGSYRYTSTSAFPNRDAGGQGYWVDVVFVNQ